MARFNNSLDHVRVAAPCKADWDQMIGNDRVRFCGQCSLNVFNLSGMTRSDAETLIARTEGRLCVRFYRRRDGSIITRDCPVGLRAIRQRVSYVAKAISSMVLGLVAGLGVHEAFTNIAPLVEERTMGIMAADTEPSVPVVGALPIDRRPREVTMGEIARVNPNRSRSASLKRQSSSNR